MAEQSALIPLTTSARDALVFANTPSHLFRLLQNDLMVQYAVQALSPTELLEVLRSWSPIMIDTPEMLLQPYSALIALSIDAPESIWNDAKRFLPNLPWVREIAALADSSRAERPTESAAPSFIAVVESINQSSWGESTRLKIIGNEK